MRSQLNHRLLVALLVIGTTIPSVSWVSCSPDPQNTPNRNAAGDNNTATSGQTTNNAAAAPPAAFQPDTAAWAWAERVSAPGSKSERRVGILSCDGKPVDGAIGELITPIGRYIYRTAMWGGVHWQPGKSAADVAGTATSEATTGGLALSPAELATGWYPSEWPTVRPGTPGQWCYSVRLRTWVDPARTAELAAANGLQRPADPFEGIGPDQPVLPANCFEANVPDSWKAWLDRMPPGPVRLCVTGKVRVRHPACKARLEFVELMKSFPPILVLRLVTVPPADMGGAASTEVDVQYQTDRNTESGSIQIVFPDGTRQQIQEIDEAR